MNIERPHVVFVDDEVALLLGLQRSLRKKRDDWDMSFVSSAIEAVKLCQHRFCHVVVTDKRMPGMDGIELVKAINRESPDTLCLMLTGTADLNDATELINSTEIFRFFTKPCDPALLATGIGDALKQSTSGSRPPSEEVLRRKFELTRSEARLAHQLLLGKSLEQAADEMGITLSSSRTYLKRVFAKTNTGRQGELVSRLLLEQEDDQL